MVLDLMIFRRMLIDDNDDSISNTNNSGNVDENHSMSEKNSIIDDNGNEVALIALWIFVGIVLVVATSISFVLCHRGLKRYGYCYRSSSQPECDDELPDPPPKRQNTLVSVGSQDISSVPSSISIDQAEQYQTPQQQEDQQVYINKKRQSRFMLLKTDEVIKQLDFSNVAIV